MATLIDASVLIAFERGGLDLEAALGARPDEVFLLASVTASELLHSVRRASKAEHRSRREALIERLLASLPVIPFDLLAARAHARLSAQLAGKGVAVGANDLLLAATAVAIGATVATRDARSFPRIPGVSFQIW